jgi:hypothetical protein
VVGDDVYALSGPGPNYYATNRLYRDEKVTVYGKPVGDYMQITPPKGRSFSWMRAADLAENGDGSATVTTAEAVVYVGSELARDARWVRQLRLPRGDKVNILDRVAVATSGGSDEWFKILPPRDEVRYVLAKHIRQPKDLTRIPSEAASDAKEPSVGKRDVEAQPTGGRPKPPEPAPKRVFGMGEAIPPAIPVSGLRLDERKTVDAPAPKAKRVVGDDRFRSEFDKLKIEIDHLQDKLPENWNLEAIVAKLRVLETQAETPRDKDAVAGLRTTMKSTRDNARRLETARDRWKQFEQKDRELAAEIDRVLAKTTSFRPNSPPAGVLRTTKEIADGRPLYSLADDAGRITHLLAVPKGLAIDKYLGRRIAVVGKPEGRTALSGMPILRVEQIQPLDSAARRNAGSASR